MIKIENSLSIGLRGFQEHRSGAVAKENAGVAIVIVEDRTHDVAADDQRLLVRPRPDELRADRQRVDKSGTCSGKIEPPRARRSDPVLNQACRGGKEHVRRHCGNDD